MGQVISLVSESTVDEAWNRYAEQAARLVANPELLTDRAFNEEITRLHERWRKLFLLQEPRA
jgi:hypothetical protein